MSHLGRVYSFSLEWLEYNDPVEETVTPHEDGTEPERPEAFDVLMQLRRFNLSYTFGGYEDQPWLLMQELNAVCDAEEEHRTIKLINAENRIKSANEKGLKNATHP